MFLKELRENGGFVTKACEAAGISKPAVYNWKKTDEDFAEEWDRVIEVATEELEKECRRRAYEGVEEPVFYQGAVCGHIRKYSDTLLMFTIKERKPSYRDKLTLDVEQLRSDIERELAQLATGRAANSSDNPASETIN